MLLQKYSSKYFIICFGLAAILETILAFGKGDIHTGKSLHSEGHEKYFVDKNGKPYSPSTTDFDNISSRKWKYPPFSNFR